jgi:hypothetical protein
MATVDTKKRKKFNSIVNISKINVVKMLKDCILYF